MNTGTGNSPALKRWLSSLKHVRNGYSNINKPPKLWIGFKMVNIGTGLP